jgi:hypothetical protein
MVLSTEPADRCRAASCTMTVLASITAFALTVVGFASPASAQAVSHTNNADVATVSRTGQAVPGPAGGVIEVQLRAPAPCRKHACRAAPSKTTAIEVLFVYVLAGQRQRATRICTEVASGPAVAGGDPVNGSDPSGLCVEVLWVCVGSGPQTSSVTFGFHPEAAWQGVINVGDGFLQNGSSGTSCNPLEWAPYWAGAAIPVAVSILLDGGDGDPDAPPTFRRTTCCRPGSTSRRRGSFRPMEPSTDSARSCHRGAARWQPSPKLPDHRQLQRRNGHQHQERGFERLVIPEPEHVD